MSKIYCVCKSRENYEYFEDVGWKCTACLKIIGESAHLDQRLLGKKIKGLIYDWHEGDQIHVANSSEGDYVASYVKRRCRRSRNYSVEYIRRKCIGYLRGDTIKEK